MKNIFFWALIIAFFLGIISISLPSKSAVQGIQTTVIPTLAPTVTDTPFPTSTPIPTYAVPTYAPPPCNGTAICNDGSCSYSAHRRGTCSHHGGVSQWL